MITITLQKIKAHTPCEVGLQRLMSTHGHLPDDKEFPLVEAFQACVLSDVLWAMRCLPEHNNLWRKYAVWCAAQVTHLMKDTRSIAALRVAWIHSDGMATDDALAAAHASVRAAAYDAAAAAAAAAAHAAAHASVRAAAYARADADADAQKQKLIEILTAGEWVGGCPIEEVE